MASITPGGAREAHTNGEQYRPLQAESFQETLSDGSDNSDAVMCVCAVDPTRARSLLQTLKQLTRTTQKREEEEEQEEIVALRAEIKAMREALEEREQRRGEVNDLWQKQVDDLNKNIAKEEKLLDEKKSRLAEVKTKLPEEHHEPPPPGPAWLGFVEGHFFMLLATIVIIANLVTMVLEMLHPNYKAQFFWYDQFFMLFYVVELALKAVLLQDKLLFGRKFSVVWWNWLDLIIVVTGILDMWIKPMLEAMHVIDFQGGHGWGATFFSSWRMVRLVRLARILKLVHVFLQEDLAWVKEPAFQGFIMSVIAFNCIVMGFESDMPHWWGWSYIEEGLLLIFSFELLVRLKYFGCRFFMDTDNWIWNWLDFIIVMGGVVDQWMMPVISFIQQLMGKNAQHTGSMGQVMTTLRMARLLRILRLVRLIKNIDPLVTLVIGIARAMQGMVWVLVLTAVFLYASALLCVRLLTHGLVFTGDAPHEVKETFPNVLDSMYVLFTIMNGDSDNIEDVLTILPAMRWVFMLFTVFSNWAILAILTSVVTDNMVRAAKEHDEEKERQFREIQETETRDKLEGMFDEIDENKNKLLSESEFLSIMEDEQKVAILLQVTKLSKKDDLLDLFQVFSTVIPDSTEPVIPRNDFVEGLMEDITKPVTERSVIRLEKRMASMEKRLLTLERHEEHWALKQGNP